MNERFQSYLTRGMLLAATCLAVSVAQAASDTPASPPTSVAPQTAPATPQKPEDRRARWRADRQAFFEARLAALHAGLQLKPDQESQWAPVESAIRGFAKLRADRWAAMKTEDETGKGDAALDRLRRRSDRLIALGQAMKTLADAAAPLMASLDATQKDRLPRLLEGLKPRRVLGEALEGGDRDSGRGMRRDRMERFGMRGHDDTGDDDKGHGDMDRGGGRQGWGGREGHAERDMREDRREDGDMFRHRHHHHDDEGADRT